MKKMSDLEYHYGLKMRIYPSTNQKKIIKINGNIARTVYNKKWLLLTKNYIS